MRLTQSPTLFCLLAAAQAAAIDSRSQFYEDLLGHPQFEIAFDRRVVSEDQLIAVSAIEPPADHPESVVRWQANEDVIKSLVATGVNDDQIVMQTKGRKYVCLIPRDSPIDGSMETGTGMSDAEAKDELRRALELLAPMKKKCIFLRDGWWTYEYCHGSHARQFHIPSTPGVAMSWEYYLGRANPDATLINPLSASSQDLDIMKQTAHPEDMLATERTVPGRDPFRGMRRFVQLSWGAGTLCDLTNRPRRLEVELRCSPVGEEKIDHVREVGTCRYKMTIQTFRLCADPRFSGEAFQKPGRVRCHPVVSAAEYSKAKDEAEARASMPTTDIQPAGSLEGSPDVIVAAPDPRDDPAKVADLEAELQKLSKNPATKDPEKDAKSADAEQPAKKDKISTAADMMKVLADRVTKFAETIGIAPDALPGGTAENLADLIMNPVEVLYVDEHGNVIKPATTKATSDPSEPERKREASKRKREAVRDDGSSPTNAEILQERQQRLQEAMEAIFGARPKKDDDKEKKEKTHHDEL